MKKSKPHYQVSIRETPDSLVIQYRGKKRVALIIVYSFVLILYFAVTSINLLLIFTGTHGSFWWDLFYVGSTLYFIIYIAIISPAIFLNSLLNHETDTITDHAVRVEKSGFGSVRLNKEFPLKKKPIFRLGNEIIGSKYISFSRSIAMAKLTRLLPLNLMRYFCPGISPEDGLAILERIGAKFPQFDVLRDPEFNLKSKPG